MGSQVEEGGEGAGGSWSWCGGIVVVAGVILGAAAEGYGEEGMGRVGEGEGCGACVEREPEGEARVRKCE